MKIHRSYLLVTTAAAAFVAALAGCGDNLTLPFDGAPGAIVRVVFDGSPADTLDVAVTDAATISAARSFVVNGTGPKLVTGRIAKGIGYDPRFPFHFIPDSVKLADVATEVCDGAPMHTAADVAAFFQLSTGNANAVSAQWCPWNSRPIAVSGDILIGNAKQ
jgi:hypothetical protein